MWGYHFYSVQFLKTYSLIIGYLQINELICKPFGNYVINNSLITDFIVLGHSVHFTESYLFLDFKEA